MQELIKRLRDVAERNSFVENTSLYAESADLIESQAAEIENYKDLCDQMGNALKLFEPFNGEFEALQIKALEAWRALK